MTTIERRIRAAQRRLWMKRWLHSVCLLAAFAGATFAAFVLVQRLYDFAAPVGWIGLGIGSVVVIASTIWTVVTREDAMTAAARLDHAAGLRERLSSGRFCLGLDDPFARAVVADAERFGAGVTVARHIRLGVPAPLGWTIGSFLLCAGMFLISPGWLKSKDAVAREERRDAIETAHVAVKREMDRIRELAESTPVLDDLKPQLADANALAGKPDAPTDVRHEALRKIDRLEDAIKQKKASDRYDALPELQKRLRGLRAPGSDDAPTQKLAQALNRSDYKTAREEVEKLQEMLATLKADEDRETVEKIGKQLDDLARQLDELSRDEKLARQLEQAGLDKEDVKRMLERLSKKDLDQIRQKLEQSGMNSRQIDKIAKQLQRNQSAASSSKKLAQSMRKSACAAREGQSDNASAELSQAARQLGELESLEQEMSRLQAAANALADARDNIDKPCSGCGGTGKQGGQPCRSCGGSGNRGGAGKGESGAGGGMGPSMDQGRGGLAQSEQTDIDFKTERQKLHSGKGAIIGQFLFDGEQVPGEAASRLSETVAAAEREASDLIHRDRVPRQYHKAVKAYFSTMKNDLKKGDAGDAARKLSDSSNKGDSPSGDKPDGRARDAEGSKSTDE